MANSEQFAIRLPEELSEQVRELARQEERNFAEMVRILLRRALQVTGQKKKRKSKKTGGNGQ